MSRSNVVKLPTLVGCVPTFVLAPFRLNWSCSPSGKLPVVVRVKKLRVSPFLMQVNFGVISQLLRVSVPTVPLVLWKLTPIYEFEAPEFETNTLMFP
jgi:hypothetical protein